MRARANPRVDQPVRRSSINVTEEGLRRRLCLGALWGGALLLIPAGIAAQSLVSNTHLNPTANFNFGNATDGSRSQRFTTGDHANGYDLTGVEVRVGVVAFTGTETVTMKIYTFDADGHRKLGDLVHTMTTPTLTAGSLNEFPAPAAATLRPETKYLVTFQATGDSAADLSLRNVAGNGQTGLSGWLIENDSRQNGPTSSARSLMIDVKGSARTTPLPPPNNPATGTVTITGSPVVGQELTATVSDVADDDGVTSPSYTYQWIRVDGFDTDISGATGTTYTLAADDTGKRVKMKVSFQDDDSHNEVLISDAFPLTGLILAPPSAPSIEALAIGDTALTVSWSAASGATGIVAYDVRYILTSADESVESNWSVVDDAWLPTSGRLQHVIFGLTNDSGYDVQVRAVDILDGVWSASTVGTPADLANAYNASPTTITPGLRVGGNLQSSSDEDWVQFTVETDAAFVLYSTGNLDTHGRLEDEIGLLTQDDNTNLDGSANFFIGGGLAAMTYYLQVTGVGGVTGEYTLHVEEIRETGSTSDAEVIEAYITEFVHISRNDADYLVMEVDVITDVLVHSDGGFDGKVTVEDRFGELASNDDSLFPASRLEFHIREKFFVDTYEFKVEAAVPGNAGILAVHVRPVVEPGSTLADAAPLVVGDLERFYLGKPAGGNIEPSSDVDYFKIELSSAERLFIRGVSYELDIEGQLLDAMGDPVAVGSYEETFWKSGPMGFTLNGSVLAGTYYLEVSHDGFDSGAYTVSAATDPGQAPLADECRMLAASDPPVADELYGCQWHLSQTSQYGGTAPDINVEDVWTAGELGEGVGVVIVDNGLDTGHPDLVDNVDTSRNHNYLDTPGLVYVYNNHGTAMAGVAAARDNAIGGRGVAPRASLYGYNLLRANTFVNTLDAMTRNAVTTGVSNNSWGPPDGPGLDRAPELWERGIEDGIQNGYDGKGVVYVWAAGNGNSFSDQSNYDEYANHYGVVAVGAVGPHGAKATYSETGPNLWVSAPSNGAGFFFTGEDPGLFSTGSYGRYGWTGGTSGATAIVTGAVALIRGANPSLTWRDVKLILAASGQMVDPEGFSADWEQGALKYGSDSEQYDYSLWYGFGMVDAKAAVDLAGNWTNVPPMMKSESEEVPAALVAQDPPSVFDVGPTVTSTVTLESDIEFVEYVEVNVVFDAPDFEDLDVELRSPADTVSRMSTGTYFRSSSSDLPGLEGEFRFGSARFLGEDPSSPWRKSRFGDVRVARRGRRWG